MDTYSAPGSETGTAVEHFDVLIVGAGLSGIGAAWHLQDRCPTKSYAILEGREASGGTWDLFRYPGVRSDSDMYTLGYRFRPWKDAKAIADGPAILDYIREVASDHGIDARIRYQHRVVRASWSTPDAQWTVEVERGPDRVPARFTCNFLWMCSGYYRTDSGYLPEFPGIERFKGRIAHPQKWTDDIDYAGKRVVVIGSGATAVTLVPAMADSGAGHVTMLQRSPTYMAVRPSKDPFATKMRRRLPLKLAYMVTRWKNVLLGMYFYQMCKRKPDKVKELLLGYVRQMLGPDYDVGTHFTPRYNPWDQRLCLVPDADFFRAIRRGAVSVVTDHIETFTETGIRLKSGKELEADLIVVATGLVLVPLGGATLSVDGRAVDPARTFIYKGMMYSDVPNLASVFGYTNASWTLKADLVCEYVCRLLNRMDRTGMRQCTPRNSDPELREEPWVNFSSGYIQRALAQQPKQGSKRPWKLYQNYALDLVSLRFGAIRDKAMVFSNRGPARRAQGAKTSERALAQT
jgi:monooxygenase